MMKISREFERWPKIVSQFQASYTWSYFDFYFLGIGEKWGVRSISVETLQVAYIECGNCEICMREFFCPYCCNILRREFFFSCQNFWGKVEVGGLYKLFNKWELLKSCGIHGWSSGRGMIFCYWWNLVKGDLAIGNQ